MAGGLRIKRPIPRNPRVLGGVSVLWIDSAER